MYSDDGQRLQWDSFDAGFEYLLQFAKANQFCVKKGRSKKKHGRRTYLWVNCVKGGQRNFTKISPSNRQRHSSSLIESEPCPFKACLRALKASDPVILDLPDATHNHLCAIAWSVFDRHRREARRESANLLNSIRTDYHGNIEAKRSWHSISKRYPETTITLSDVRNERSKIRALMDEGLPVVQALIRSLGTEFAYQYVLDKQHRLVHLLFFHYTSLQNLGRWPYTLQLDVTYPLWSYLF